MDVCLKCEEMGLKDCANCTLGNPCLDCKDYDWKAKKCKSNGGCGEVLNKAVDNVKEEMKK